MMTLLLLLIFSSEGTAYGFDSGTDQGACGRAYRSSRMHQPPCDLLHQTYCTTAGSAYPWHAVRRFIRENQGLMRRMYGDERQIAVLRAELETNDINDFHFKYNSLQESLKSEFKNRYAKHDNAFENELLKDEQVPRYFHEQSKRDDIMNTKFIYSEEPSLSVKLGDLKTAPHFRPTTSSPKPVKVQEVPSNVTSEAPTTTTENSTSTESSTNYDEESTMYDTSATEFTTTTDEATETTVLLGDDEETTTENTENTENSKKDAVETLLFQDATTNNKKAQNHINYNVRGINACPVKEEVVAPFWANNTRGEVLALLNLYPFEQYVHWEKCTYEHRQMYCREGCRCEQQYRLHRLLAYDPNNECKGIFSDWFRFPSCCVCKCYNIPSEFRVTSRSPRSKETNGFLKQGAPMWFKKRNGRT